MKRVLITAFVVVIAFLAIREITAWHKLFQAEERFQERIRPSTFDTVLTTHVMFADGARAEVEYLARFTNASPFSADIVLSAFSNYLRIVSIGVTYSSISNQGLEAWIFERVKGFRVPLPAPYERLDNFSVTVLCAQPDITFNESLQNPTWVYLLPFLSEEAEAKVRGAIFSH